MPKLVDLTGQRFGNLTAISVVGQSGKCGAARWLFRCDCGTEKEIRGTHVRSGKTSSCGCYGVRSPIVHGLSRTPEHAVWAAMLARCRDPNNVNFHRYGARGIRVCARWALFENFISDMGNRPSKDHSLDRKDNDGDYTPDNCRWATRTEQQRNMRGNHFIEYRGKRMTIAEAAAIVGVDPSTMWRRIANWTVEQALTTPAGERRST